MDRNLTVKYMKTDILIPYANNARTHTEAQVKQVAASIKEFGFTNPILIDEKNGIIAGHCRIVAAELLDMEKVPTILLSGLTDAQRRAYVIADNKLALNAGWDAELLKLELTQLSDEDFDLEVLGFNPPEIEQILGYENDPRDDQVPEVPDDPISKLGDLWLLGDHRVLCGDAENKDDVEKLLDKVKPHLMVTDPPYGVEYDPGWRTDAGVNKQRRGKVTNDDTVDWRDAWNLFPGNIAYIWHAGRHASLVQASIESAGFKIRCQIIWAKNRFAMSRGDYHWQHEPCWYAVKGTGNWTGDRKQSTLWNIDINQILDSGHGAQKPVECMRRPMVNNSSVGQVVYDPFLGSGTTVIAAEKTGRICYGLEIAPEYVDVIVNRWQEYTGNKAELAES